MVGEGKIAMKIKNKKMELKTIDNCYPLKYICLMFSHSGQNLHKLLCKKDRNNNGRKCRVQTQVLEVYL